MARYTGAVCRLCRRYGEKLYFKGPRCFSPKCAFERRPAPPGMHGVRRRRVSDRGVQLREKQKAKRIYGLLERQFRTVFSKALRTPGMTGENLVRLLELRMDNIVYRLGFADSRSQARQLVTHGMFQVNGRNCNIPSRVLKPGETISWCRTALKSEYYKGMVRRIQGKERPRWLSLDPQSLAGQVMTAPERQDVEPMVKEQAVVEYYSR